MDSEYPYCTLNTIKLSDLDECVTDFSKEQYTIQIQIVQYAW